jgi:hypothetical protein
MTAAEDKFLATRATVLVGEVLHLTGRLFPPSYALRTVALQNLNVMLAKPGLTFYLIFLLIYFLKNPTKKNKSTTHSLKYQYPQGSNRCRRTGPAAPSRFLKTTSACGQSGSQRRARTTRKTPISSSNTCCAHARPWRVLPPCRLLEWKRGL